MPFDLEAASGAEYLVLYDPASIPDDLALDPDLQTGEPESPTADQIEGLARSGRALVVHIPEADCEARFRVFVDEPLPMALASVEDVPSVEGVTLRVPSGLVRADGAEFLVRPGEVRAHAVGGGHPVPSGHYRLSCRSLLLWKARNRGDYVRERTTRAQRVAGRVYGAFGCVALAVLAVGFLAIPALGMWWGEVGWRRALPVVGWVLGTAAAVFVLFWLLERARRIFGVFDQVKNVHDAFELEYPDLVVEMALVTDGSSARPGTLVLRTANTSS